ncbi:anthrone oxygenase family protein [Nonomuraea africana]|uniref:Membrane protein n=1 Tax=Nonomuraea africana TaxID=46171 RepID=A0ABR9K8I4_9ACTN|nr:anthrone oxygenase family protein [Nonomuraea africana]MBE1558322.1 putative membrane protein [Nonomuraea africana]
MKTLSTIALILSTLSAGLMAGLFAAFSYSVMPGLRQSTDRTLVEAMQKINVAILNPVFLIVFMGGLLFTLGAVALHWQGDLRPALPWVIAGCVLYLVMFGVTSGVNVPLNDQLAKAGDPAKIADLAAVREAFEARWVTWNIVRALAATGSFGCFIWALIVHGQSRV